MNEQKQTNLPHKYGKKIAGVLRSNAWVFTAVMWTGSSSQSSPYPKSSPTPLAHPLAPIHGITVLNFHYEILSDSKIVAKRGGGIQNTLYPASPNVNLLLNHSPIIKTTTLTQTQYQHSLQIRFKFHQQPCHCPLSGPETDPGSHTTLAVLSLPPLSKGPQPFFVSPDLDAFHPPTQPRVEVT